MATTMRHEDLTFLDRAPLRVRATREIAAPPAAVWAGIADAEAWPAWFPGLTVARYTTPEPYGVGTGRHVEVRGLVVDEELLAFDVDARYAFVVLSANRPGIAAMVEDVTLEATATGTRVTYVQALEPGALLRLASPVLRRALPKALADGLAGLERWVVARGDDAG